MRLRSVILVSTMMCLVGNLFGCADTNDSTDWGASPDGKIKVESLNDLPRTVYPIDVPASELMVSDEFAALVAQVDADVGKLLDEYDIQDTTTLQTLYNIRSQIAFFDADYKGAIQWLEKRRALEDKEANRLTMGLILKAWVAAHNAVGETADEEAFKTAFADSLAATVATLPWDIVQNNIERVKGQAEIFSDNLILGIAQTEIDRTVAKSSELTEAAAWALIDLRDTMDLYVPVKEEIVAVYTELIAANRIVKPDIWADRSVSLDASMEGEPVVIGIWDTGVDASVFEGSMWTNPNEKFDGADTDGNGFVDDVHGIGFDLEGLRTPDLLQPVDEMVGPVNEAMFFVKGLTDIMSSIDSDEASELKRYMSGLRPEEVESALTTVDFAIMYVHGTHVAGIAIEGNPFARILISRYSFDYHQPRRLLTIEIAKRYAQSHHDAVDYFRAAGVRTVNMSWGWDLKEVEGILEANGVTDPEERKAKTDEIFSILKTSLRQALASAPDILFVVSAGNADNDVEFDEMVPMSFDLPNVMVVAAVDQAGDPTNFTSSGKDVVIYASGFEVDSFVPGGARMQLSGTSMSAPNALNLAAKLIALDPGLKPTDVIELITQGATPRDGDETMLLLHPNQSIDLLEKRL